MARNYIPAAAYGAESFLGAFFGDPRLLEEAMSNIIVTRGNPEPVCLMDVFHLWLASASDDEAAKYETVFTHCPTYEAYLQTVLIVTDMWQRAPEQFVWREEFVSKYGLEPLTQLFPALPEEDLIVNKDDVSEFPQSVPRSYTRGEIFWDLLFAQYDHPALRRETYEHYKMKADIARERAHRTLRATTTCVH